MMKLLRVAICVAAPCMAHAQGSLTDQINAVDAAQKRQQSAEAAAQAAQRAAQQAYERRLADQQRASLELQKQHEAAVLAEQARLRDENRADKYRDQVYQDQMRKIELERKQIEIDMEKARLARINEFIDQDLKSKAAETDVVQSGADANRNISSGAKSLLEKTGDAAVKKESGFFK